MSAAQSARVSTGDGLVQSDNACTRAAACVARVAPPAASRSMLLSLTRREKKMLAAIVCLLLLGLLGMLLLRAPDRSAASSGFSGRGTEPSAQSAP